MNREQLKEEYDSGRLDPVARLQHLKDDIRRVTGLRVPSRPAEVAEWYDRNKAVLARRLAPEDSEDEDKEDTEEDETDTESDNE